MRIFFEIIGWTKNPTEAVNAEAERMETKGWIIHDIDVDIDASNGPEGDFWVTAVFTVTK